MLGEIEGKRRRGQQKIRWLDNLFLSSAYEIPLIPQALWATAT